MSNSKLLTRKEVYRCFRKILADCRRRGCELHTLVSKLHTNSNNHTIKVKSCIDKLQSAYEIDITIYETVNDLMYYIVDVVDRFKEDDTNSCIIYKMKKVNKERIYYLIYNEHNNRSSRFDTFVIRED